MKYKQKKRILAALVAVLALVYALSFVLDPGRSRSAAFAWLDPSLLNLADRIEISGIGGSGGIDGGVILIRRNNVWVFGTEEYPVKQAKVNDFLAVLSRKDVYALRAVSSVGGEKLGFSNGNTSGGNVSRGSASRILVRGGPGMPLLDLLVGGVDALGREVYLKRADKNEVFSGEDHFTLYTESKRNFWYDLRLFPAEIAVSSVQQAEVSLPRIIGGAAVTERPGPDSYMLRRSGGGWQLLTAGQVGEVLDANRVEAWLRSVLEAEAEDFSTGLPAAPEGVMTGGGITLRLGDGSARTIQAGAADEQKRRIVSVTGSHLSLVLSEWTLQRLFRESPYFIKTE